MTLKTQWENSTAAEERAIDTILPFEILLGELASALTIPRKALIQLQQRPARTLTQLAYRQWAALVHNELSLFSNIRELHAIIILGSMLTAHLLVLSARRCGIKVLCCLDTSTARIGRRVFGVPVVAHEELAKFMHEADAVILSSEREHDDGLREMLQARMGKPELPIHSWKYIAKTASNQWMELDSDTIKSNFHSTGESRKSS
jgi:FlaA1/EpsC-like NDP-sugar epimerase